ncbi:MAG: hypothetical protein ABR507_05365 [Actinomycetota bacterium]|nr:hypothetical protein [Actinomycetota bacterium]
MTKPWLSRTTAIATCFVLIAAASLAIMVPVAPVASRFEAQARSVSKHEPAQVDDTVVPDHRQLSPKPPPPSPSPKPSVKPKPKAIARNVDAYRGLGTWVDVYDSMEVGPAVTVMAKRGVKTIYLETSSWKIQTDLFDQSRIDAFLSAAHAKGIAVVGWYLPGFADMDRDIRRSALVLSYRSSAGQSFDGFAADIESRVELNQDRVKFNASIVEYGNRLRAALPNTTLGGIVVDAKNNERAPARWAGFPWPDIGRIFDVVMPMAYWSVTRNGAPPSCQSPAIDVGAYMSDVMTKTRSLMGISRPMHLIGGIADCVTASETSAYVDAMKSLGSIGGGLYDFATTDARPDRDAIWSQLARLDR